MKPKPIDFRVLNWWDRLVLIIAPTLYFLGLLGDSFNLPEPWGVASGALQITGALLFLYGIRYYFLHRNFLLVFPKRVVLRMNSFFGAESFLKSAYAEAKVHGEHLFIFTEGRKKRFDFSTRNVKKADIEKLLEILHTQRTDADAVNITLLGE